MLVRRIRESFAAKILAALVGTLGVLLLVTFVVVRSETSRQVGLAVDRAVEGAALQLRELEEIQRLQIDRLAYPLTEAPRALAALEEVIRSNDLSELADRMAYDVDFAGVPEVLLVLTDADGAPLLTLHNREAREQSDPVGLRPVAEGLLEGTEYEVRSYRAFEDGFYHVLTRILELGPRMLGTVSYGLPITDADMVRIGALAGAEVCFVLDGTCVAGTVAARDSLAPLMAEAAGSSDELRRDALGRPWAIRADLLVPGSPAGGSRVVAVPLDRVVAPFRRITQALLLGGLGALALALAAGSVLSRGLTRPVRALVAATGRVGGGDYEAEVSVDAHDEIGTLAEAFNDMTRGLRLKERYRAVLDKVVSREVAEELMASGVELGGENREVTVLFADIRGFTALTEGMEPQGVIGLLNECMQRLSDAVDAEGGVVDKYVGDELMAVFGAPVGRDDDPLRAVRAAVRMRDAMAALNEERAARGEGRLGVGIGLNTGEAVAGNMGSSNRMNYTVLGDVVNMASRLCGGAGAGEVLVTGSVLERAGPSVVARPLGGRSFKGFSSEVEVHSVDAVEPQVTTPPGGVSRAVPATALLLAGSLALAAPAAAQDGWPTLADAGLAYISESGAVQIDLSGRLDLEFFGMSGTDAGLAEGDGTWIAPRLRLFTDVFLGDHVYGLFELRGDRGSGPFEGEEEIRLDQAFLRASTVSGSFGLQVGRFASPFGSYAQRHLTDQDPFGRPPLPYDFRTSLAYNDVPSGIPRFHEWRDDPKLRGMGAPPIWGVPYQWGTMASVLAGAVNVRVAVMNSAPSSEPAEWNWDRERAEHPSVVVGAGVTLSPSLSVGAGWSRGPYLQDTVEVKLANQMMGPMGEDARFVYDQDILSADLTWARGSSVVRAEAFLDRWDVPNVDGRPTEVSYTVEAQTDLTAGLFAAVRFGRIDFLEHEESRAVMGRAPEWDYDLSRYEASLGYRVARNAGVLVSGAITEQTGPRDADDNLLMLRLWWAF